MNTWLTDIEGMFQSGLTDVHFQSSHWGILASKNTLKMELEARTSRIPGDTAIQPNNYDLTTMFSTFLIGASPLQFGYGGFIRKPTVLYGPSILGFASLPTHSTTKKINENVEDESNELDEIYAAIFKNNPELATDSPSTPQTYYANEPITYDGMRKVLGGNGSGTPDGLYVMGVGLSIAAKKGGEIAANELLLNDIETLRDPSASKTDKGIALFSLTPMGKLKKAAEGIEEGKDLLEHVIEVQQKAEKAKDTAKDAKKSVDDFESKGNDKYNTGTMKHIYHGEINKRGKAVGYHHESMMGGKIIPGTEKLPDKNGVYMAKIEVGGVRKVADSIFFPKEWNRVDVLAAIDEAYQSKQQIGSNKYKGITSSGIKIEMYINKDGSIATAYPLYKK